MSTLDRAFIKAFADSPILTDGVPEEPRPPVKPLAPPTSAAHDPLAAVPLSSFAAPAKVQDASRAMLEVDRLSWPAAATEFAVRAGRPWELFAGQLLERAAQGQKCAAIASQHRGDGRTTLSLAMARHAASRGLRPVVVDVDVENPALARSCGVSAHTGWNDLVSSELPLGEALILAVEDGVTLLPWRGAAAALGELAGGRRTGVVFGALREQYDLVVLDAGPLAGRSTMADVGAFAAAAGVDALYLIHNVRSATRDDLVALCAKLRRVGLPLAGVVENFVAAAAEPAATQRTFAAGRSLAMRG
jgi:Mrp family chromosome partitioning ATPase